MEGKQQKPKFALWAKKITCKILPNNHFRKKRDLKL